MVGRDILPKVFCPPQHTTPATGTGYPATHPTPFNNAPPAPSSLYHFGTLPLTPYPQERQIRQIPTSAGQGVDFLGMQPAMGPVPIPLHVAAIEMNDMTPTIPVQFPGQYNSTQMQPVYNVNPYHDPYPAEVHNSMTSIYPPSTQYSAPTYAGESIAGPMFPFAA